MSEGLLGDVCTFSEKSCKDPLLSLEGGRIKERCVSESVRKQIEASREAGGSQLNSALAALNNAYYQELLAQYKKLSEERKKLIAEGELMYREYVLDITEEQNEPGLKTDPTGSKRVKQWGKAIKDMMTKMEECFRGDPDAPSPILLAYQYVTTLSSNLKVQCDAQDKMREAVTNAVVEDIDTALEMMDRERNPLSDFADVNEKWQETKRRIENIMGLKRKSKFRVLMSMISPWTASSDHEKILEDVAGMNKRVQELWDKRIVEIINKIPESTIVQKEVHVSTLQAPYFKREDVENERKNGDGTPVATKAENEKKNEGTGNAAATGNEAATGNDPPSPVSTRKKTD